MPRPSRLPALLDALTLEGGLAHYSVLEKASSAPTLRAAVRSGQVLRIGGGLYGSPDLADAATRCLAPCRPWHRAAEHDDRDAPAPAGSATAAGAEIAPQTDPEGDLERGILAGQYAMARAHGAVLSHRSAARHHGWTVLIEPERLELCVPKDRRVRPDPRVRIRRWALPEKRMDPHVTDPLTTVLHCAADLPFPEGLAVADSALAHRSVGPDTLRNAADTYRGPHPGRVRRVAACADGGAANPFESALRAAALDVPGLSVVTQHPIHEGAFFARVDLADPSLRIVIEADSYLFHGKTTDAFTRDVRRYDELVARDWLVLRFTLAQVTRETAWVIDTMAAAVAARRFATARPVRSHRA